MILKILFFGDSHLGFDMPLRPRAEIRRRGEDFFRNHNLALKYALDHKVDLVIHGGDLFYRTLVPQPIINRVYDELFAFAENGIPIVIVPGNHESSRLPVSLFLEHRNIHIFKKIETHYFKIRDLVVATSGFPCVRKDIKQKYASIVTQLNTDMKPADLKILCMHQAIEGAKVGPSNFTFRYGPDVIKFSDLTQSFDAYLSGHIHRQQILWKTFNNGLKIPVIYPGSVERTAFAEMDETKGFFILEFDPAIESCKLINTNFIELPTRPMVDIDLSDLKDNKDLRAFITKRLNKVDKDAIVRFRNLNPELANHLTAKILRDIAPKSMNFQMGSVFRKKNT